MTTHDFFEGTVFESNEQRFDFCCNECSGWWSIDSHTNWKPTKLYCVWCGQKHSSDELNYKPRYDPPLKSVASEKYAKDYDDNGYYTTKSLVEASRSKIVWNKGFKNE